MAVALPVLPRNAQISFREVSRARRIEPTFGGGPDTVIRRLGDRHQIAVSIPALASGGCGPGWVVDLLRGRSEGAVLEIPEPKLAVVAYGTPLVRGASQLGSSLVIDGLPASTVVPKGKWLSVIISGQRFAYLTTAEVTANASGVATLPIWPMLRRSPPDNAVIELAAPKIEGLVLDVVEREVARIGSISLSFTIQERE